MPFRPDQMFDVVNDVARYPEFLPWCSATEVIEQDDTGMLATLELAMGGMSYRFTTRNRLDYPGSIRMKLVRGLFRSLDGHWRFDALGEAGCKISLDLSFTMESRMMSLGVGTMFGQAADRMVDAFCQRAERLYG